jgi:arabinofuranosyltransferase
MFFTAGFLAFFLPYFIWRFIYFGHLFPCPFYAKGGTNIFKMLFGARYLLHFLATFGFPLVLILFINNFRNFTVNHFYLISLLLAYSVYVFVIGGDHMPGFRFFVPILPLFYLFIQECFYAFRFKWTAVPTIAVAMFLVTLNFYVSFSMIPQGPEATIREMKPHFQFIVCPKVPNDAAYFGRHVGIYIKNNWSVGSTIALNAAGAVPYFSGMSCIDMLGLNNYPIAKRKVDLDVSFLLKDKSNIFKLFFSKGRAELSQQIRQRYSFWQLLPGHGKGDGKYVLSQKPDYIILGGAEGSIEPWFLGDQEIFNSQDFENNYELKSEPIQINDDFHKFYKPSKTGILEFKYYMRKQQ